MIKTVTEKEILNIIETYLPLGKFLTKEKNFFVAVDNVTGDAWTEEFKKEDEAIAWLNREEPEPKNGKKVVKVEYGRDEDDNLVAIRHLANGLVKTERVPKGDFVKYLQSKQVNSS